MTTINLLPWREQLKEEMKQLFFLYLTLGAACSIALMLGIHFFIQDLISSQLNRNTKLQNVIATYDSRIQEIAGLEKQKNELLAHMNIIHQLQTERTEIVHVFDDIAKIIPQGVYLTSIKREGSNIVLRGRAESNTRVSELMRNIESSSSMSQPVLNEIKSENANGNNAKGDFILQAKLKSTEKSKG